MMNVVTESTTKSLFERIFLCNYYRTGMIKVWPVGQGPDFHKC